VGTNSALTTGAGLDVSHSIATGTTSVVSIDRAATYTILSLEGSAVNINVAGTARAAISSTGLAVTGTLSVTTGAAVGGATAGAGGLAFPATAVAVADANTLDDYEEGTWTPSIGGTAGYSVQNGTYTKIGRVVTLHCYLGITTIGTGSTTTISGAPFTCASYGGDAGSIMNFNTGVGGGTFVFLQARVDESATTIKFTGLTAAASTSTAPLTMFDTNASVAFTVTYFV